MSSALWIGIQGIFDNVSGITILATYVMCVTGTEKAYSVGAHSQGCYIFFSYWECDDKHKDNRVRRNLKKKIRKKRARTLLEALIWPTFGRHAGDGIRQRIK